MSATARVRLGLLVATALVLQLTLLNGLRLDNVHADALLLVTVAAGYVGGADRGALVGFACGLVADLFAQTPYGLSALAFCIVGYGVGLVRGGVLRTAWWIPVVTAAAATAAGELLFALLSAIVGQPQVLTDRLGVVIGVTTLFNGILARLAVPAMGWAMQIRTGARPAASSWGATSR